MREQISWELEGCQISATLDIPDAKARNIYILIVSGGNEIRSGSHNSQSHLAQYMCAQGFHVLRYDRRGIGDSEGDNLGFEQSRDDIMAAIEFLRAKFSEDIHIVGFGNCDAASALLLYQDMLNLNKLIIANPWTIDTPVQNNDAQNNIADNIDDRNLNKNSSTTSSAAAIRARYWVRIKNPRTFIDLFTGKIDLRKLIGGLLKASQKENISDLGRNIVTILSKISVPTHILIANKDTTAMGFLGVYNAKSSVTARKNNMVQLYTIESASHSFADNEAQSWLYEKLLAYAQITDVQ